MADAPEDDYEIIPHKEIVELREELKQLKQLPTQKGLQGQLIEVSQKIETLLDVFREAEETIRVEEGHLSLQEKLAPLMERMDKILEQNSQIAQGIVALADIIKSGKEQPSELFAPETFSFEEPESKTAPAEETKPLPRGPLSSHPPPPSPPPFRPER